MKSIPILIIALLVLCESAFTQSCFVAIDSAKGTYTGECKKGKANGKGKYEWVNGHSYEGEWKNGLFDGFGILTRKISMDSIIVTTGYWKKGEFIGRYEKPYLIELLTNNISGISAKKNNSSISEINIVIKNSTGGASNVRNPVIPKYVLSNIQLLGGQFEDLRTDTLSRIASRYTLTHVTFPFTAIFSFSVPGLMIPVEKARIEIFETGNWNLNLSIEN